MTMIGDGRTQTLQSALEAQFNQQTAELTRLTTHRTDPEHNGLDPQTVAALIDSTRQALADTAAALKRMADGTYGRCERCQQQIPIDRLEARPSARFCVPCQHARHR